MNKGEGSLLKADCVASLDSRSQTEEGDNALNQNFESETPFSMIMIIHATTSHHVTTSLWMTHGNVVVQNP